ncbi:MAG: 4-(cytidine 5'-diphospho)-2-C-methyl-D-erythritol kinase [Bacillota bacterium]|nr:4-(cytidine 5'-diphospho)-2-C-methyl-D-erythritol kinase [Bacillota bacterium]
MNEITIDAHAKVNLCLDVLGKLPNGYHEVRMVMQQLELSDTITVKKTGRGKREIIITTNADGVPVDYRNLAHRAAQLMLGLDEILDGVEIHIEKRIPVEAGLAGGSADCAATLAAMNILFDMGLSTKALCRLGARLGSDVPFCIMGGTVVAEGTGTRLTPVKGLNGDKYTVVLCKPEQGISTGAVYGKYSERMGEMIARPHPDIVRLVGGMSAELHLSELKKDMINVLEYVTAEERPEVREIINIMKESGADAALMTGSGPTVFGLFENSSEAEAAYSKLSSRYEETVLTKLR